MNRFVFKGVQIKRVTNSNCITVWLNMSDIRTGKNRTAMIKIHVFYSWHPHTLTNTHAQTHAHTYTLAQLSPNGYTVMSFAQEQQYNGPSCTSAGLNNPRHEVPPPPPLSNDARRRSEDREQWAGGRGDMVTTETSMEHITFSGCPPQSPGLIKHTEPGTTWHLKVSSPLQPPWLSRLQLVWK